MRFAVQLQPTPIKFDEYRLKKSCYPYFRVDLQVEQRGKPLNQANPIASMFMGAQRDLSWGWWILLQRLPLNAKCKQIKVFIRMKPTLNTST
ncbi:MAG: hypothetical protein HKN87_20130 [Saprospiraceae bacterium]|nr:hypothetical protein [Saprospiraceae bacterium]